VTAIRSPAVAGTFYPADPTVLRNQIAGLLAGANHALPTTATRAKAIIGPHAGYVYSGSVAASAYARLGAVRGEVSRVVLIGPSHHVGFRGIAVDTTDAWMLPNGTVALDTDAITRLHALPMVRRLDAAFAREHALEVHVPFLQHVLGSDFRLVPLVAGDAPADAVATVFDALWGGAETLFVVSTDLSHYLDYAAARAIDLYTAEAIEHLDHDKLTPNHACGCVPTRGILLSARQRGMVVERLDLRNSGDTAGPKDRVVGYGAWALYEAGPETQAVDAARAAVDAVGPMLLQTVRCAIEIGLNTGQPPAVVGNAALPSLLAAHGAAFVTLRQNGQLRGCVGSAVAWRPLVEDVVDHAFNAAFRDPRFPPLALGEESALDLSVSVLTPAAPITFSSEADLLAQLRPGVDGLMIDDAGRRALFLPSVWADIPDAHMFITQLKLKSGMPADHFSSGFTARRFCAVDVKGRMADHDPAPNPVVLAPIRDPLGGSPQARRN